LRIGGRRVRIKGTVSQTGKMILKVKKKKSCCKNKSLALPMK